MIHSKYTLTLGLAASLSLLGCHNSPQAMSVAAVAPSHAQVGSIDVVVRMAPSAAKAYRPLFVQDAGWTWGQATLSNTVAGVLATPVVLQQAATVTGNQLQTTFSFNAEPVSNGYQLTVQLFKGNFGVTGQSVAINLTPANFTLNPGTNSPIVVTLSLDTAGKPMINVVPAQANLTSGFSTSVSTDNYVDALGLTTPATTGEISGLDGDGAGTLFVADTNSNTIWQQTAFLPAPSSVTIAGGPSNPFGTSGMPANTVMLDHPRAIVRDQSGKIFFVEEGNGGTDPGRVRVLIDQGGGNYKIFTVAGALTGGAVADGTPALNALVQKPYGLAVDSDGDIYFADRGVGTNGSVRYISHIDNKVYTLASAVFAPSSVPGPLAIDRVNHVLYVGYGPNIGSFLLGNKTGTPPMTAGGLVNLSNGTNDVTALAYDGRAAAGSPNIPGFLYFSSASNAASFWSSNATITRVNVDITGAFDATKKYVVAGNGVTANGTNNQVNTPVPDARMVPLGGLNWNALYVEMFNSVSSSTQSGVLYSGNSWFSGSVAHESQLIKLTPKF